jgi:hypothetical protein
VVNEEYATGKLYCLNAYLTDPQRRAYMQAGMIRAVRVIEGMPGTALKGRVPVVRKRILGEAPVEPDGSFNIEVPADLPVQIQTLDENGMALETCGWIWVKQRESRGCIGCHEDPELTPENRLVDAVRKPSVQLSAPPAERRSVDFGRDLMPIITAKCATAECHGSDTAKLRLTDEPRGPFNVAYEGLLAASVKESSQDASPLGRYVHPGQARTSPLIWRLYGRNTSRPWDDTYEQGRSFEPHPPAWAKQLTAEELETFVEWIDLGAHWKGVTEPEKGSVKPQQATRPAEDSE